MDEAMTHLTPDEERILKIANGDRDALSTMYLQHKGAVFGFALSMLHDRERAEDVMQETFIQLWNSAASYIPRGKEPLSWLLGITKNLALRRLRTDSLSVSIPEEHSAPADPLDHYLAVENKLILRAVLTKLSEEEQQIVLLHAVSGLKHREIADLLDMPLSTVLNKYRRALQKLKKLLGESI